MNRLVLVDTSVWLFALKKDFIAQVKNLSYKIRREGMTIPYTDILIAACALKYNFLLLHADRHFDLLSNHIDLKVESFVKVIRGVGH